MKKPYLNEFDRFLIREETLEGARLLVHLEYLKFRRQIHAELLKIINYLNLTK